MPNIFGTNEVPYEANNGSSSSWTGESGMEQLVKELESENSIPEDEWPKYLTSSSDSVHYLEGLKEGVRDNAYLSEREIGKLQQHY